jgi:cobalt-zinc-cadmium efflux system outer membrane protein
MKRIFSFVLITLLLFATPLIGGEAKAQGSAQGTLQLSELIEVALERNPEIIAAQQRWESAQEIIEAKRAFPDPQFSYTYFVEPVETRVGPQKNVFGARQTFPFYGKRDLRADVASKKADALEATYEAVKQEIVRRVKRSFYALFYVVKIIDITKEEKEILKRFEHIARTKYATGKGSQQNILKVHVEISRLEDRLLTLANQKQTAEAMINTLLDRPADYPLGGPVQPKFREFFYIQPELFRLSKENRPELKAGIALIEKSEKAHSLAEKEYYPDLTLGANYYQIDKGPLPFPDNGEDAFNVMFSINIPIWRTKLSSQVRSASQMIRAQKSEYENILNRTRFEVKDNYFKIQTARESFDLYKNVLIPQAEQSMKSAEVGYTTGIVDFLDLLDAERVLLRVQFGYWRAYADYLARIADMERAVGIELPEYRPEEVPPEVEED